jgi:2,3-bisphosphoglycerate-dependent phosphoglycerate mutase
MRIKMIQIIGLVMLLSWMPNLVTVGQTTRIYIVRHAEKNMQNPSDTDPPLSKLGHERANDLRDLLKEVHLDAIFSTNTIRTEETARPVAKYYKLKLQEYEAKSINALVEKIHKYYTGENILVVGHSNTVRPTIQALGGTPSVTTSIPDTVYNLLYIVTIDASGTVEVEEKTYGK